MTDTHIRSAAIEDVPAIERVARRAWHAAYDDLLGADAVEQKLEDWYSQDVLRAAVEDDASTFVVGLVAETVVGFAQAGPDDDGDWHLARIYVDPDDWNNGVGSAMLDAVEERLREAGVEQYELAVLAGNDVGVSFYESRGFERFDTRERELAGVTVTEYWYRTQLS